MLYFAGWPVCTPEQVLFYNIVKTLVIIAMIGATVLLFRHYQTKKEFTSKFWLVAGIPLMLFIAPYVHTLTAVSFASICTGATGFYPNLEINWEGIVYTSLLDENMAFLLVPIIVAAIVAYGVLQLRKKQPSNTRKPIIAFVTAFLILLLALSNADFWRYYEVVRSCIKVLPY